MRKGSDRPLTAHLCDVEFIIAHGLTYRITSRELIVRSQQPRRPNLNPDFTSEIREWVQGWSLRVVRGDT